MTLYLHCTLCLVSSPQRPFGYIGLVPITVVVVLSSPGACVYCLPATIIVSVCREVSGDGAYRTRNWVQVAHRGEVVPVGGVGHCPHIAVHIGAVAAIVPPNRRSAYVHRTGEAAGHRGHRRQCRNGWERGSGGKTINRRCT